MSSPRTRELLVLRHAKSDWDAGGASDRDRELSKRGRRAAPRMGEFLASRDLAPDHVIASPAVRALQTVAEVAGPLGFDPDDIDQDDMLYLAPLGTLLGALASVPAEARRVLIVGHNPGLEHLVDHLAGGDAPPGTNGKLMPTAACAHFRMPDDWTDLPYGCAELVAVHRARELE